MLKKIGPFNCEVMNDVRNTFDGNIIINDGNLYSISIDLKFSNEQNCMKVDDTKITKVINNYYIDEEGNAYIINDSGLKKANADGKIPQYMMEDDVLMAHSYGQADLYTYYVLKTDGKIYDVTFERDFHFANGVGTYRYTVKEEKVYKEFEDEKIKSFDIVSGNLDYVITDKGLYVSKVTNMECHEYADIDCVYDLVSNTTLTSMENISFINHYDNTIKFVKDGNSYNFGV